MRSERVGAWKTGVRYDLGFFGFFGVLRVDLNLFMFTTSKGRGICKRVNSNSRNSRTFLYNTKTGCTHKQEVWPAFPRKFCNEVLNIAAALLVTTRLEFGFGWRVFYFSILAMAWNVASRHWRIKTTSSLQDGIHQVLLRRGS
jgi:hypothetical protein